MFKMGIFWCSKKLYDNLSIKENYKYADIDKLGKLLRIDSKGD